MHRKPYSGLTDSTNIYRLVNARAAKRCPEGSLDKPVDMLKKHLSPNKDKSALHSKFNGSCFSSWLPFLHLRPPLGGVRNFSTSS